jgi:hypothetical protein
MRTSYGRSEPNHSAGHGQKIRRTRPAIILFIAITALALDASAIGVSPAIIVFNHTVRGGYAEKVLLLSTAGSEELTVRVESGGVVKDWIKFEPNQSEFEIPKRSATPLTVKVSIPVNIQNGYYEGKVVITTLYKGREDEENTSYAMFMPGLIVNVQITVTGDEVSDYRIRSISARNAEQYYPVEFTVTVENTGNVLINPRLQFTILDDEHNPVGKYFEHHETSVLPTVTKEISIKMQTDDMSLGDYYAKITSDRNESYTAFFQILQPGTLAVRGTLEQISLNKIWVRPEETVRVEGLFRNEGERAINSAKLKCEAHLVNLEAGTNELIGVFDGTSIEVPVGERITLESYFTPKKSGRYSIDCVTFYSGRTTDVKSTVLNVMEAETAYYNVLTVLTSPEGMVTLLLIAIAILIAYIYRRRRM